MTSKDIESRLWVIETVIAFLEAQLTNYREQHSNLTMDLNRARRLEREELQK
jgi:hypothetical protein